jgi:hypothetical protein
MMRTPKLVGLTLALAACASTPESPRSSELTPEAGVHYTWQTTVPDAPAAAGIVRIEVAIPRPASLRDLRAVALVGNAPFEVRLPGREPGRFASGPLVLEWSPQGTSGALVIEARGRVPEVGLRFVANDAEDSATLDGELRAGTRVLIDGRTCPAAGRLERVR